MPVHKGGCGATAAQCLQCSGTACMGAPRQGGVVLQCKQRLGCRAAPRREGRACAHLARLGRVVLQVKSSLVPVRRGLPRADHSPALRRAVRPAMWHRNSSSPEPPLEGEDFRHGRQESAEEKKVPVPGRLTSHQALDIRAFLRGPLPAVAVPPRSAGCPVPVVESWPPGPCVLDGRPRGSETRDLAPPPTPAHPHAP